MDPNQEQQDPVIPPQQPQSGPAPQANPAPIPPQTAGIDPQQQPVANYPGVSPNSSSDKLNTLAVISLVVAILAWPFALFLGPIALRDVNKRGERGRGLAIASIVISTLFLVSFVLFFITSANRFQDTQAAARDAERKTDINALIAWVAEYENLNGMPPAGLSAELLPDADPEALIGPQGEAYSYKLQPLGCTTECESVTIETNLEEGGTFTKTFDF